METEKQGGANLNDEASLFYHKMIRIGIPVLIQQIVSIGLNLMDTIMVGRVSENALAAVGAANQIYFIYSIVIFGIFSGASVYAVQYWGIRDLGNLRKIVGIDYLMSIITVIPTMALVWVAAPQLMGLFTKDPEVIALGVQYLHIVSFSYLFAAFSFVISFNSRAIQDLTAPTAINAAAIALNVILNYGLIYGHLGLPELGVEGAAIATLTARILECIVMHIVVRCRRSHPLKASLREMVGFSREMFRNVMETAIPVILTEGLWALSVSMIFAAYGRINASALAIVQVAATVTDFFQAVYFAVGNASAVIIGESLGQGRRGRAWRYSKNIIKITWVLNLLMTLTIILLRQPIAAIYNFDAGTTETLMNALLVYAVALSPKMLVYMIICGILRAGGDTMFCMYMDVAFNMGVQVPLAFLGVLVLHLSLPWAIALVSTSEFMQVFVCYRRYYSKKWLNVITDMEEID